MQVYFIAHGNAQIGMGHVMRTLSLAEAFRDCGHNVSFFSRYQQGADIIARKGFDVEQLEDRGSDTVKEGFFYGNPEELSKEIDDISKKLTICQDLIVLDSYNVTPAYLKKLKKFTRCLIYIDDLNAFSYPVDIIINGTASAGVMKYKENQTAKLLLGVEYNLLRSEFRDMPHRDIKEDVSNIIITTGNSDPFHITEKLLRCLLHQNNFKKYQYHVVIGKGFEEDIWSDKEFVKNKQILLYDAPNNMHEIMLKCDLAITAGGSTLYELAACGVPAIAFAYADNQLAQIKALERKGLLKYIGRYDELEGKNLIDSIKYLVKHFEYRKRVVSQLQNMVDGNGVRRIVKEVEAWMK